MNVAWALVLFGAMGLIGLFRYLHHREVMTMLELGRSIGKRKDLGLRETWRVRLGFLVGAVTFAVGVVISIVPVLTRTWGLRTSSGAPALGDMVLGGSICVGVGLAIAVSHWIWSRQPISIWPSEVATDTAISSEQERRQEEGGA
jgi:hypothetical protein